MKKFIPFLCLLVAVACAKTVHTPPTPAFSVTASVNGVPASFNAIITVDSVSTPGTVYIVAHADSANLTPLLELTMTTSQARTIGVYSSMPINDLQGLVGYTGWNGDTVNQYNSIGDTLAITTSNKSWFSGTFQGVCQYTADSGVIISNGRFTVGWKQQ